MKAGAPGGKSSSRRIKHGRQARDVRRRYRCNVDVEETEMRRMGYHWHLLGFSILLVACLSFVNFLTISWSTDKEAVPIFRSPIASSSLRGGLVDPVFGSAIVHLSGSSSARASSLDSSSYNQRAASPDGWRNNHAAGNAASVMPPALHYQLAQATRQDNAVAAIAAKEAYQSAPEQSTPQQVAPEPPSTLSKLAAGKGGIAVLEGDSWFKLDKNVDANEITFGAWIFLPNAPVSAFPESSLSMKTIASTKVSGCKTDVENSDGWALFVHEWGTFNQQLRLSWTDPHLACNELFSDTVVVPFDKWVIVGFSMSEARDSARLVIDGNIVADTKKNLGSLMKAGRRVTLSEAVIRERRVRRVATGGGSLVYGAHIPQSGDQQHVQSHVFYGFLGDMRLLHTSPEDPEHLIKLLASASEELLAQTLVPASSIVVQLQFKVLPDQGDTAPTQNLADGQNFNEDSSAHGKHIKIAPFTQFPKHPWFMIQNTEKVDDNDRYGGGHSTDAAQLQPLAPLVPLSKVEPQALKNSWPQEWIENIGESKLLESQRKADGWAEEVRAAMVHTWRGYTARAWGHDDLKPISGHYKDWCRLGITILDSLTTLWLMGLKDEFAQATKWLKENPLPSPGGHGMHSVFEMIIRGLGGLLGAYALSGEQIFLQNAQHLADCLLHAFNTPSGMPKSQIDLGTGASRWHSWVHFAVLAEVTTVQVEFRYLSHIVGDDTYKRAADKAFDVVLSAAGPRGLVPIYLTMNDEVPHFANQKISLGAMGDSYYEYLIKQWVQNGKKEDRLKNKWKDAMKEMLDQLVRKTQGGLTYICEKDNNKLRHRMDHLACFVAGMLMMGAKELPPEEVDPRWEPTAAAITETCYQMYRRSASGLSPEYVIFHADRGAGQDMQIPNDAPHNLLRPEAAEALYYMHYYTGDPKYREWAHDMFQAFERNSKSKFGYASVRDVRRNPPQQRDDMESFWAAETLKYLFLIMAPRSHLSLEEYVFNTEAHPLPRWK